MRIRVAACGAATIETGDNPMSATRLAFVARGKLDPADFVSRDVLEIGLYRTRPAPPMPTAKPGLGLIIGLLAIALGLGARRIRG